VNYAERYLGSLVAVVAPWEECIETVDDTGCVGVFLECRVLNPTVFSKWVKVSWFGQPS
jgi:hypothetical protein